MQDLILFIKNPKMRKLINGYGEKIWEDKIKKQNEAGVIFGSTFSLEDIRKETQEFMSKMDREVIPFLKKSSKILDLGVGPVARFSIEFARRGYYVTGVDISSTILKIAREYAKKAGTKIDFIKEDITKIDKIGKKFDMVFCRATFYHIPPHLTGMSLIKIGKILKKNGILVIEFGVVTKKSFRERIRIPLYWLGHNLKRIVGRGFGVNVSRFTRREINEMIETSGFKVEKMVDPTTYLLRIKN